MLKLGKIVFDGTPRVAVSIADGETNARLKASCADVIEVRVDQFADRTEGSVQKNLARRSKLRIPLILTVRNDPREGARPPFLSAAQKLRIFESAIGLVDAVDIELSSELLPKVMALARRRRKTVIVSVHDFRETPSPTRLERILQRAKGKGADIVKVAVLANSPDDVRRLLAFTLKHRRENLIVISLGTRGAISRLAFPAAGSLLTIGYLDKPMAPGQLPVSRLKKDLRAYYPAYKQ